MNEIYGYIFKGLCLKTFAGAHMKLPFKHISYYSISFNFVLLYFLYTIYFIIRKYWPRYAIEFTWIETDKTLDHMFQKALWHHI